MMHAQGQCLTPGISGRGGFVRSAWLGSAPLSVLAIPAIYAPYHPLNASGLDCIGFLWRWVFGLAESANSANTGSCSHLGYLGPFSSCDGHIWIAAEIRSVMMIRVL